jgi:hypothetical protein
MVTNVWEFLGKPKDYRAKPVMLVKHLDEVPDSRKEVNLDYLVQIKYDGVYCMIVMYCGIIGVFGRTGNMLQSVDCIMNSFNSEMSDGVYIGELCNDEFSLEQLSGVVNPNRVNELRPEDAEINKKSYVVMHDLIPINSFIIGECETIPIVRWNYLRKELDYQDGEKLILIDCSVMTIEEARDYAIEMIKRGNEGIVLKFLNTSWKSGHKGWKAMKIVRGVDYDLECIGYEEGSGKYEGKVANLIFGWKGDRIIKAMLGKGWTHAMAEEMWNSIHEDSVEDSGPLGKIFSVYALQESSKGVLRLPKVGEMRHDKDESDL